MSLASPNPSAPLHSCNCAFFACPTAPIIVRLRRSSLRPSFCPMTTAAKREQVSLGRPSSVYQVSTEQVACDSSCGSLSNSIRGVFSWKGLRGTCTGGQTPPFPYSRRQDPYHTLRTRCRRKNRRNVSLTLGLTYVADRLYTVVRRTALRRTVASVAYRRKYHRLGPEL